MKRMECISLCEHIQLQSQNQQSAMEVSIPWFSRKKKKNKNKTALVSTYLWDGHFWQIHPMNHSSSVFIYLFIYSSRVTYKLITRDDKFQA